MNSQIYLQCDNQQYRNNQNVKDKNQKQIKTKQIHLFLKQKLHNLQQEPMIKTKVFQLILQIGLKVLKIKKIEKLQKVKSHRLFIKNRQIKQKNVKNNQHCIKPNLQNCRKYEVLNDSVDYITFIEQYGQQNLNIIDWRMESKEQLIGSMEKLIRYIGTNRKHQSQIFSSLSHEDFRKILLNLSDINKKLRTTSLNLLFELLYDNQALKKQFCNIVNISSIPGKVLLNPNQLHTYQNIKEVTLILKEPVKQQHHRSNVWYIDPLNPLQIQYSLNVALNIDPMHYLVGIIIPKSNYQKNKVQGKISISEAKQNNYSNQKKFSIAQAKNKKEKSIRTKHEYFDKNEIQRQKNCKNQNMSIKLTSPLASDNFFNKKLTLRSKNSSHGVVNYKNLSLSYRDKIGDQQLKDKINMLWRSGHKGTHTLQFKKQYNNNFDKGSSILDENNYTFRVKQQYKYSEGLDSNTLRKNSQNSTYDYRYNY